MPTVRCPEGHETTSLDYCDVCGAPVDPGAAAVAPSGAPPATPPAAPSSPAPAAPAPSKAAAPAKPCPACQTQNPGDALFCESCGYDFTTGQLPPPAAPKSSLDLGPTPAATSPKPAASGLAWVAEIWVDPAWYERNREDTTDPCPAAGAPKVAPLSGTNALVGRPSASRQVHPQVDCSPDSGVSRRHAQLLLEGEHWYVEDLGSTNGTYVAGATAALPTDPIPSGQRRELDENDRIYVGTWTRIVVRRATTSERSA
jgi:hypothetical protein